MYMTALKVLGVFTLTVALDYVWAIYTLATADRRPLAASFCAIGIYALGGLATIGYTSDHWLLIPAVLGCFVGTFTAVRKKPDQFDHEAHLAAYPQSSPEWRPEDGARQ